MEPARDPEPPGVIDLAASSRLAPTRPPAASRRSWMASPAALGITALISAGAALLVAFLIWGRRPAAPPETTTTEAPARSAVAAPTAEPPATATSATAQPVAQTTPPPTGVSGGCLANIRTDPEGAQVMWKGEALGNTPLANVNVPCGTATVTLTLEGFVPVERAATAFYGRAIPLFVRMNRPRALLQISSTPQGALAIVNGIKIGRAPVTVTVDANREASIVVAQAGYRVWSSKVTPVGSSVPVHAALVPLAKGQKF